MYHLLATGEAFFEEGLKSKRRQREIRAWDLLVLFDEALSLLAKAGYVNTK